MSAKVEPVEAWAVVRDDSILCGDDGFAIFRNERDSRKFIDLIPALKVYFSIEPVMLVPLAEWERVIRRLCKVRGDAI